MSEPSLTTPKVILQDGDGNTVVEGVIDRFEMRNPPQVIVWNNRIFKFYGFTAYQDVAIYRELIAIYLKIFKSLL